MPKLGIIYLQNKNNNTMKKYAIVMLLVAAVGFTACGNGSTGADAAKADSTKVDSTVVATDSTATVDTTAAVK